MFTHNLGVLEAKNGMPISLAFLLQLLIAFMLFCILLALWKQLFKTVWHKWIRIADLLCTGWNYRKVVERLLLFVLRAKLKH